jgi:hypothetical protein
LAKKIQIGGFNTRSLQKEKKDVDSVKPNLLDYFLNESFVKDFFEVHMSKLNLSDFRILNCEINPLKIGRSKSAIELKLELQSKSKNNQRQQICKCIVGKWRSDGQGKEIFDLLQEVWHKGFDDRRGKDDDDYDDHLKIYEPIAYFPDYNLMLTSKAGGTQLENMLMEEGKDHFDMLEFYVTRAAMWLAKLHSISNLTHVKIYSMQQEEKKLNEWSQHLSIHPDFGDQLHTMLSCILKIERSINSKCFVLIHNGFHPGNIFVDGPDLTVIDFDHSCIFDPAVDLGYFIAKLLHINREYNLSLNVEALQKRFLDTYAAARVSTITTPTRKETLERVDLYKARTYLRHLHSKYCQQIRFRYNHKPDPIDFEYWVNKAEECLKRLM